MLLEKDYDLDLKTKFRLVVGLATFGLLTLSGFWLYSERSSLLAEKQEQAKNLVAVPYSIIDQQYRLEKEGKISREEAQRRATESVKGIHYDGDNYFWINDMHPTNGDAPHKSTIWTARISPTTKTRAGKPCFLRWLEP